MLLFIKFIEIFDNNTIITINKRCYKINRAHTHIPLSLTLNFESIVNLFTIYKVRNFQRVSKSNDNSWNFTKQKQNKTNRRTEPKCYICICIVHKYVCASIVKIIIYGLADVRQAAPNKRYALLIFHTQRVVVQKLRVWPRGMEYLLPNYRQLCLQMEHLICVRKKEHTPFV